MGLLRRRKAARPGRVPELVPVPAMADLPTAKLQSPARYLGTLTEAGDPVIGQTLAASSTARLSLSAEALDVVRMAGSFRIPVAALRGATSTHEFAGKPVESLLVVRWQHGDQQWRTGFRLEVGKHVKNSRKTTSAPDPDQWVRTISKMSRGRKDGVA